ncbi:MAG: CPBP family intramembrane metalloprotease [Anaerolineales bacterium]|nr:CPBP family intramembrane metalloprotease [Anaerolineales bacterium]
MNNYSYNSLIPSGIYSLVVIGFWTIWCLLMVEWPQIFALPSVRAIARVSIVFVPAMIFYLRGNYENSIFDYFLLRKNWVQGVIFGVGIATLYFSLGWLVNGDTRQSAFHFPTGFSIWVNFILGSPLAEEAFFRGVLLQELRTAMGTTLATVVSAFAFTLLHLPQWLILDNLFGVELLSLSLTIFTYGIIFAIFVNLTQSLWASLLPHWINNFILQALAN